MHSIDGAQDHVRDIAIQNDGKILVVGYAKVGSEWEFALLRYDVNGVLDPSFGTGGKVTSNFGSSINYGQAIAIDDDKIIVVGQSLQNGNYDFALARYLSDGTLDPSFDGDGLLLSDFFNDHDRAYDVVMQEQKIIVVGYATQSSNRDFALVRYDSNGSIDLSFGSNGDGKVLTNITGNGDYAQAVSINASGDIVVAGYTGAATNTDFAIARYDQDGVLDNNFDGDGIVTTDIAGTLDEAYAMTLDFEGNIVLAGRSYNGSHDDFALARYLYDGSLDPDFGINGIVITDFSGDNDEAHALVVQGGGTIIAVGQASDNGQMDFGVLRIGSDGDSNTQYDINVSVLGLVARLDAAK